MARSTTNRSGRRANRIERCRRYADRRSAHPARPLRDNRDDAAASHRRSDRIRRHGFRQRQPLPARDECVDVVARLWQANNFGSMRDAQSDFGLLDQFENAFVRLQGTWNQDLIQPQQFALQRLPDATVTGRQELFNNLMFADYDAEAVNFYRYQGIDGCALDANPRVTLPWRLGDYLNGYGQSVRRPRSMTPPDTTSRSFRSAPPRPGHANPHLPWPAAASAHFQQLCYVEPTSAPPEPARRIIPYAKAGISTVLDRVYDFKWKSIEKLKNTIEPFANYYYVPNIYQGNSPCSIVRSSELAQSRHLRLHHAAVRQDQGMRRPRQTTTDATPTEGYIRYRRFGRRAVPRRTPLGFVGAARRKYRPRRRAFVRK